MGTLGILQRPLRSVVPSPSTFSSTPGLRVDADKGPISSLTVLGKVLIILSDANDAFELMDTRGQTHSDRPRMVFGFEMYVTYPLCERVTARILRTVC